MRIIAASQIDLDTHIAEGTFRSDLYYRLSVVRIKLPPLRERREDIAPITRALLKRRGIPTDPTPYHLLDKLMAHDWPGNVRELRNVIERSIALSPHAKHFADLHIHMHPITHNQSMNIRTDLPYSEAKQQLIQQFECAYLKDAYARHDGNLSAISRDIQLDRKHLRNLLKKHDLI